MAKTAEELVEARVSIDWSAVLITQVYILQAMLVADAHVAVSWGDGEEQHEDVIVKIGWSDPAQLTSQPISAMPADYRGLLRLYAASCAFHVRIEEWLFERVKRESNDRTRD